MRSISLSGLMKAWDHVSRVLLITWFVLIDVTKVRILESQFAGIDAKIYADAATRALAGGDPWLGRSGEYVFAGPPPTLLFFLPTAWLPQVDVVLIWWLAGAASAVWIVRRLRLPWYWILFPPLVDGIMVANPDPVVLALLLAPGWLGAFAPVMKIYALIPLLGQRRWRVIIISLGLCLLSLPWWGAFLADRDAIAASLAKQAGAGFSAWASVLIVPTMLALWMLRRNGAGWLAVPAAWPYTQHHYGTLALPVVATSRVAAAIFAYPATLCAPIAVIYLAVKHLLAPRFRLVCPMSDEAVIPRLSIAAITSAPWGAED